MDSGTFDLVKAWFVENEAFLSSVTALIAIASGLFLTVRQVFGGFAFGLDKKSSTPAPAAFPPGDLVDTKPTVAVLPFRCLSQGDSERYLADGIADDIIVNLSYSRLFPVIASATAFAYRDSTEGVLEIGRKLKARYIITGTIGLAGDKLRINVEVNDCESERQLWSDRYTRDVDDIFALQEEIAETLIAKIDPALRNVEMNRARRSKNADAWNFYLKGMWHYNRYKPAENDLAIEEFQRALEFDDQFAHAHANLALAYYMRAYLGWSDNALEDMIAAGQSAQTAVSINPELAEAYLILAYNALMMREFDKAEQLANRAMDLNPCSGHCWLGVGLVNLYRGRHEQAASDFVRVERLNPNDPVRWLFRVAAGLASMMMKDYEAALGHAGIARTQPQGKEAGELITCAALVAMGRAAEAAQRIEGKDPVKLAESWSLVLSRMPFESGDKTDFLMELVTDMVPELKAV